MIRVNIKILSIVASIVAIIIVSPLEILQIQFEASTVTDLRSRDFDKIPNFIDYGVYGLILRLLIWPFIFYTGLYVLISPSFEYIFLLPGVISKIYIIFRYGGIKNILMLYVASGLFAALAPGFTSYARYSYPLLFTCIIITLFDIRHRNNSVFSNLVSERK